MANFDKHSDVIDSRDVIERIEELQAWKEETPDEFGDTDQDELDSLLALQEEASGSPDWKYGETLIRDTYFERYAQELAEDIGAVDRDAKWPYTCIDWKAAARELQWDYFSVEFDGVTYWIRA